MANVEKTYHLINFINFASWFFFNLKIFRNAYLMYQDFSWHYIWCLSGAVDFYAKNYDQRLECELCMNVLCEAAM